MREKAKTEKALDVVAAGREIVIDDAERLAIESHVEQTAKLIKQEAAQRMAAARRDYDARLKQIVNDTKEALKINASRIEDFSRAARDYQELEKLLEEEEG